MHKLLVPSLCLFCLQAAPAPEPLFQASANGTAVNLRQFHGGYFGQFELTRPAEVEIRAAFDVRWVDVRPRSAGIVPAISPDHTTLRFTVRQPVPLTIEFNGDWKRNVIHLFANEPEKDPPAPNAPGVRYFGPGEHDAGLIELKDGESLYLAAGAYVKGNVRSIGTKKVTIKGRGILDGSTYAERIRTSAPAVPDQGTPPTPDMYNIGRRAVVYLEQTEGTEIEGITLLNSDSWNIFARWTNRARIRGIRIISGTRCGTDGIDIVGSNNMLVENVFVRANDDCVAVKSMDENDPETRGITVRRSVLWNMPCGNALEIGFEVRRNMRELRFEDIDVIRVERGSVISIHNGDNGAIENVLYSDIRVEDATHKLIDFAILYGQYGVDRMYRKMTQEDRRRLMDSGGAWDGILRIPPEERAERAKFRGRARGIRVTNMHVVEGRLPFSVISGFDKEHPIKDVTIENLRYLGRPIRSAAEAKLSAHNAPALKVR